MNLTGTLRGSLLRANNETDYPKHTPMGTYLTDITKNIKIAIISRFILYSRLRIVPVERIAETVGLKRMRDKIKHFNI